ncbi:hypothetical protein acsn021_18230 [Anaerocolumna cellulosilytica]|uniref:DUF1266 domain-containing protein n=1 Tax=Anaerocolumna cellulosilytica TaxID=433286 RepID=A0A6S6QUE7_9FIRM|nr:DUF1266 domain-containing protein [Anaerocolumna cellulosilytica]MBB5194783.1 hypothetical protein [Anaerocolumna cellulosilytica]BCJ94254.1 hypothetical protein acsn021_18230 [Anaerocolumna cellulosilytica]
MFNFFSKSKKIEFRTVENCFLTGDAEMKAVCSNAFFGLPDLFLDIKLCSENREQFIKNNFFNLRYMGGTEASWDKNKAEYIRSIKEALESAYGITDQESYEEVFLDFYAEADPHAWNMVRIAGVTQNAYTAEYINAQTAKENIGLLGNKLLENYNSWEQVATDFLSGKLQFIELKAIHSADDKEYTSIINIVTMIDLLFNDKDTPLKKCLFSREENLHLSSNSIFQKVLDNLISVPQRARNIMKVYKDVYGWRPFILSDIYTLDEKDKNTYNYVKNNLKLEEDEEIVYIHAFTSQKPEKSDISFVLTNKNLITVFNKKDRQNGKYVYTPLAVLNRSNITLKEVESAYMLFIDDAPRVENISLNSKREISAYQEILSDMIAFLNNIRG